MSGPASHRWLPVGEVAMAYNVSRGLIYRLAADGELPCMRLGRRVLVDGDALGRLVAGPASSSITHLAD